jgi:chitin synthase
MNQIEAFHRRLLNLECIPGYQSGRNTPQSFYPMAETTPLQPSASQPSISDLDLERAVQDVLRSADLNLITKREIRRQLESHFGIDLTSRKAVINAAIDRTLLDQN